MGRTCVWVACLGVMLGGCSRGDTDRYLEGLRSANPEFQMQAVVYLGQHGDASAVPALLAVLESGPATDVKRSIAEALGRLADPRAAPSLLKILQDPDPQVRTAAIVAMAKINAPEFVASLAAAAQAGDSRLPAIWALGVLGDPQAVPVLSGLLHDPDKYVRYNARQALKRLVLEP